jgi:rRNA maturation RNase YbeY
MIAVQITKHFEPVLADTPKLRRLVRAVCRRFGLTQAVIDIGIVGDAEIAVLNQRFLNHEGATDCLSFDLSDRTAPGQSGRGSETRPHFELIVNGAMAGREAARRGHSAEAELALYVTHALLHHLGFDDATAAGAREMHRTEDEILQHLGYGLVYNGHARAQ